MADPQGLWSFAGIPEGNILEGSYSLRHGISPGVATLTILPTVLTNEVGTLSLTYGGLRLDFPDMKVDAGSFVHDSTGQVIQLNLLDRRWKWRFGAISGNYNLRKQTYGKYVDTLLRHTEKKPTELMALCLQAMGETGYDLGGVPNLLRPEVHWSNDNPAQELARLADLCGCRVVLKTSGRVGVYPVGVGARLPEGGEVISMGSSVDLPEKPDLVMAVCGPTLYQIDVLLEAVGLDLDGQVKPVNDLSYTPSNGWTHDPPTAHPNAGDTLPETQRRAARDLAVATVWRWYRIHSAPRGLDNEPLTVPGYTGLVMTRDQLLPLETEQVEMGVQLEVVTIVGVPANQYMPQRKPALIWGYYAVSPNGRPRNNLDPADADVMDEGTIVPRWAAPGAAYRDGFSIRGDIGVIVFSQPVYAYSDAPAGGFLIFPATLALRTACSIRAAKGAAPDCHSDTMRVPGKTYGTGPRVIHLPDIQRYVWPTYSERGNAVRSINDNTDEGFMPGTPGLDKQLQHYLSYAVREYQVPAGQEATYTGILPLSPDGAIQEVGWTAGSGPAETRAGLNTELGLSSVSYKERRFLEELGALRREEAKRPKGDG